MALFHTLSDLLSWLGWYVVPFVIVLSAIVFFHELGHYLVGRWCGVKIDTFSLGFGPELAHRIDSRGTRWRIGALPLGGYVKFYGDANVASFESGAPAAGFDREHHPSRSTGRQARGDRGGRADRELHSRLCHLYRHVHDVRPGRTRGSHQPGRAEQRRGRSRVPGGRPDQVDRRQSDPQFRGASAASTLMSTGLPMTFGVERDGKPVHLTATPQVTVVDQGVSANVGWGISASPLRPIRKTRS